MLALNAVSKNYYGSLKVLDQIHLKLGRGDFLYVIGGSGTGKSSLLRMIATEEMPSYGSLSLFGYELGKASSSTLTQIRRAIGYIPQDIRLIPDLTVFENIAISLHTANKSVSGAHARKMIGDLLERLGLIAKRDQEARLLSGGEAQRVAVARALIRSPELVVADEPTGAQDRDHTWSLMDVFVKANLGGATLVIATHDQEIVRRVPKRCATLKNGHMKVEDMRCIY